MLRSLSFRGIPSEVKGLRPLVWKILLGYLPKETAKWEDGNEYPLYKLEISDKSHPFFTGKQTLVDTAGRVEKFRKRYERK
jgi:ribosomal protein L31